MTGYGIIFHPFCLISESEVPAVSTPIHYGCLQVTSLINCFLPQKGHVRTEEKATARVRRSSPAHPPTPHTRRLSPTCRYCPTALPSDQPSVTDPKTAMHGHPIRVVVSSHRSVTVSGGYTMISLPNKLTIRIGKLWTAFGVMGGRIERKGWG